MNRILLLVVLLAAAAAVGVWWPDSDEQEAPAREDRTPEPDTPATLIASPRPQADEAPPPDEATRVAKQRLAELLAQLTSIRAAHLAGVASQDDLDAARRALWLADAAAKEISEKEAYAHVVKLDANMLARAQMRFENGRISPGDLWPFRVRLHQSKRRAGDDDERFLALRAEYLEFIEHDHAARLQAAVAAPRELPRRLFDACRAFPLDPGERDEALEAAGAKLRDMLAVELGRLRTSGGSPDQLAADELEIWEVRGLTGDVDARTLHTERARIYERVLRELERREVGLVASPSDLAIAKLRMHRERFILGDEDQEYVRLREKLFLDEGKRLGTLLSNGVLSPNERHKTFERLRREFPPPATLHTLRQGD